MEFNCRSSAVSKAEVRPAMACFFSKSRFNALSWAADAAAEFEMGDVSVAAIGASLIGSITDEDSAGLDEGSEVINSASISLEFIATLLLLDS